VSSCYARRSRRSKTWPSRSRPRWSSCAPRAPASVPLRRLRSRKRALARGFVTAQLGNRRRTELDSLEALVRAVLPGGASSGRPRSPRPRSVRVARRLRPPAPRASGCPLRRTSGDRDGGGATSSRSRVPMSRLRARSASRSEPACSPGWTARARSCRRKARGGRSADDANGQTRSDRAKRTRARCLAHRGTLPLVPGDGDALLPSAPARREVRTQCFASWSTTRMGGEACSPRESWSSGRRHSSRGPLARRRCVHSPRGPRSSPARILRLPLHRTLVDMTMPDALACTQLPTPLAPRPAAAAPLRALVRACQVCRRSNRSLR